MKIQDLRSQFTVFVFLPEVQITTDLKQSFVSSGYDTYMFIDQDMLVHRVKEAAPHVIVFSPDALVSTLSEFTKTVLEANSEVQFVCVAPASKAMALNEYRDFNYAQIIDPDENLEIRALWAVDTICEKLALQYQNEHLLDQVYQGQQRVNHIESQMHLLKGDLKGSVDNSPQVIPLLEKFGRASTKEEFVQAFMNHIAHKKLEKGWTGVYFKFLPSVVSFVATQGYEINLERTKGVGAKITAEEYRSLDNLLRARTLPHSLDKIIREAFRIEKYTTLPLFLKNQIEGALVFWGLDLNEGDWGEFLIFQLCYQNANLQKKVDALEVLDPVTELHNRSFFYLRLEEEISRSRRITKPVSIVRLALDKNQELELDAGFVQGDLILRSIALLIKKTSRVNDFTCRTGEREITLILPHCSRKGAALRAERLRRAIESHSFALNGARITVSSGVSEYPSLCSTGRELDRTATQALEFITAHGGNKVCLFKPEENFKPDFEVSSV